MLLVSHYILIFSPTCQKLYYFLFWLPSRFILYFDSLSLHFLMNCLFIVSFVKVHLPNLSCFYLKMLKILNNTLCFNSYLHPTPHLSLLIDFSHFRTTAIDKKQLKQTHVEVMSYITSCQ